VAEIGTKWVSGTLSKGESLSTEFKDQPLFMFFNAEVRTSDVNVFCDTGNSHILLRDKVPGDQLYGIRTRKGPFPLCAVGNTTVWAHYDQDCTNYIALGQTKCIPVLSTDYKFVTV
jgi:hypothetical protein